MPRKLNIDITAMEIRSKSVHWLHEPRMAPIREKHRARWENKKRTQRAHQSTRRKPPSTAT